VQVVIVTLDASKGWWRHTNAAQMPRKSVAGRLRTMPADRPHGPPIRQTVMLTARPRGIRAWRAGLLAETVSVDPP